KLVLLAAACCQRPTSCGTPTDCFAAGCGCCGGGGCFGCPTVRCTPEHCQSCIPHARPMPSPSAHWFSTAHWSTARLSALASGVVWASQACRHASAEH